MLTLLLTPGAHLPAFAEYSEDGFETEDGGAAASTSSDGLSVASAELEKRRRQLAADLKAKRREILRRSKRQSVSC